ncbi:MAG: hypothetical protein OIF47_07260 [Marinibacterium sp.]|nr:hypothetical protein [Marinibacterium sp.]
MPILSTDNAVSAAFDIELTAQDWWLVVEHGVTRINHSASHSTLISMSLDTPFDAFVQNSGTLIGNHAVIWFKNAGGSLFNTAQGIIQSISEIAVVTYSESTRPVEINNAGMIRSDGGLVISTSAGDDIIVNTGRIEARDTDELAIATYEGDDTLINRGTIIGGIELDDGKAENDVFDGRGGYVSGIVKGGRGHDTYIVDQPDIWLFEYKDQGTDHVQSLVSWTLKNDFEELTLLGHEDLSGKGNHANNVLNGNSGNNTISGLRGNDALWGMAGDDRLIGNLGHDTLDGGDGDDFLAGRDGADVLRGGDGNDVLRAGPHQDVLDGGYGADTLHGGGGGDTLTGGQGEDVFVFDAEAQSGRTYSVRDKILDFEDGWDLFDLRTFGLTFARTGFTGTKPEVRFTALGDSDSQLRMDIDGDGVDDMRVDILGVRGLTLNDLIL